MPNINLAISPFGPLVDVVVDVSEPRQQALLKAGQQVPPGVVARILIDTGASGTCIDRQIFKSLGISPTGAIDIHTPSTAGTPVKQNQYDVKLTIPHVAINRFFDAVPVTEADFQAQGIQGLLGRDILRHCAFFYNGETGLYTLSF